MSWQEIPNTAKGVAVLIVTLVLAGVLLRDFIELPERVSQNEARITTLEELDVRATSERRETAQKLDQANAKIDQVLCMLRAERGLTNWEDCVSDR